MRTPRVPKVKASDRILNFLREDPSRLSMTYRQIAEACACSIGLVTKMRRVFDPDTPKRVYTHRKVRRKRGEPEPVARVVTKITSDSALSTDQKRELLTRLAQGTDVRDEAKISAIRALHAIDDSLGKNRSLGPGKPLTDPERVHRLYLLIASQGPEIANRAMRLAQEEWASYAGPPPEPKDPTPSIEEPDAAQTAQGQEAPAAS